MTLGERIKRSMISEWLRKRIEVKRGILSEAEYLEWKWGLPQERDNKKRLP